MKGTRKKRDMKKGTRRLRVRKGVKRQVKPRQSRTIRKSNRKTSNRRMVRKQKSQKGGESPIVYIMTVHRPDGTMISPDSIEDIRAFIVELQDNLKQKLNTNDFEISEAITEEYLRLPEYARIMGYSSVDEMFEDDDDEKMNAGIVLKVEKSVPKSSYEMKFEEKIYTIQFHRIMEESTSMETKADEESRKGDKRGRDEDEDEDEDEDGLAEVLERLDIKRQRRST
jgi:hypothetical protein